MSAPSEPIRTPRLKPATRRFVFVAIPVWIALNLVAVWAVQVTGNPVMLAIILPGAGFALAGAGIWAARHDMNLVKRAESVGWRMCPFCAYDLSAHPETLAACSECGKPFDEAAATAYWRVPSFPGADRGV